MFKTNLRTLAALAWRFPLAAKLPDLRGMGFWIPALILSLVFMGTWAVPVPRDLFYTSPAEVFSSMTQASLESMLHPRHARAAIDWALCAYFMAAPALFHGQGAKQFAKFVQTGFLGSKRLNAAFALAVYLPIFLPANALVVLCRPALSLARRSREGRRTLGSQAFLSLAGLAFGAGALALALVPFACVSLSMVGFTLAVSAILIVIGFLLFVIVVALMFMLFILNGAISAAGWAARAPSALGRLGPRVRALGARIEQGLLEEGASSGSLAQIESEALAVHAHPAKSRGGSKKL